MNHALKTTLEEIYSQYHKPRYMRLDPVEYLRRFTGPGNMEIAGLLASSLAYGKVESIRGSIERVFSITGYDLIDFIRSTPLSGKKRLFRDFKHRFTSGDDIALLFECVGRALVEKDSLGALFSEGLDAGGRTIKQPLNEFSKRMRSWAQEISKGKIGSFSYLFPMPETGSACKRLNMYLRWMVRPDDGIDLGIWKNVETSKLVIPVDTHVAAIARRLSLTVRKTADWRMAEEITESLKIISPSDPVKYDFSLCRCGMVQFRRK
jgi:uncharacterized protein (TIGR02757 family)